MNKTQGTMSLQDFKALSKAGKPSKYRNVKTVIDGITFDSAKEAKRWGDLIMMERGHEISELERRPRYPYVITYSLPYKSDPNLKQQFLIKTAFYEGDFRYIKDGVVIIEDVKGNYKGGETAIFKRKKKIVKALYGIDIKVV